MNNYKIGTRMIAGFAAVVLVSVISGLYSMTRVADITHKSNALATNYLPASLALGRIRANTFLKVNCLLRMIPSTDAKLISSLDDQIGGLTAAIDKDLAFYESTPFTPEEQAVYDASKAERQLFREAFAKVKQAGKATDSAANAQAMVLFESQLQPSYTKYAEDLDRLAALNERGANQGMDGILAAASSSNIAVILGLVFCVALAIPITLVVVRSIVRPLAAAVSALSRVAENDLTIDLEIRGKDEIATMSEALNRAAGTLRQSMKEVSEGADQASSSSRQLAAAATSMATGAQEQAASLEETSASLEQITASVRQSADNAREASRLANDSREAAEKGKAVVVSAVSAMSEINAASAQIAEIISTIDEIAFQTNLLAVNAAVEAARAGDEGRGFAVVATEVRSLAQRSAGAAKEIKGLIQDSLRKVNTGSELVNKSGDTLESIVVSFKRVTDIVGEIATAIEEQSTGVEQVNTAVTQMDQVTQQNAAQTEELSSTAETLSDQSARLLEVVASFQIEAKSTRSRPGHHSVALVPLR